MSCFTAIFRLACPYFFRMLASVSSLVIPFATTAASFALQRKPFCPLMTSSAVAPAATATAGSPLAMASIRTMLWVSVVLVIAKTLAVR